MIRSKPWTSLALALLIVAGGFAVRWAQTAQARQDADPQGIADQLRSLRELLPRTMEVDVDSIVKSLPSPEKIHQRKLEICDEMMKLAVVELVEPPTPTAARGTLNAALADYIKWSDRLATARSEGTDDENEQLKIVAQEVARLRELEKAYGRIANVDRVRVTPKNLLDLEYQRLLFEERLAGMANSK